MKYCFVGFLMIAMSGCTPGSVEELQQERTATVLELDEPLTVVYRRLATFPP